MKPNAFTLTELAVSTAIIAGLVAISLPVLSRSKYNARMIQCQAQLNQWGKSIRAYQNDQKDYALPTVPFIENDPLGRQRRINFTDLMASYLEMPRPHTENGNYTRTPPFWCPSQREQDGLNFDVGFSYYYVPISYNSTMRYEAFEEQELMFDARETHAKYIKNVLNYSGNVRTVRRE